MKSVVEKINDSSTMRSIKKLHFRALGPEEILKLSSADITTKSLYDIGTRKPSQNGPLDLRLGVSTKVGICETCNEGLQNCAGHFGHIKLILPVYHIGFLKHIVSILNCVCKNCGSLLISFNKKLSFLSNQKSIDNEFLKIDQIKAECKKAKYCPQCKKPNGTVKKNTGFRIFHEIKTGKEIFITEINPQTCLNIFKMIPEDEYEFLGLKSSPSNFIIQNLIVPPSCIRPSVDMQEEGFNEDDLTVKLSEIVNTNNILEESIQKGNLLVAINDDWDMLQLQVALFMNSNTPSVKMQSTPMRGILQRLDGKQGRFRCNLNGKRVDFSGRTVISPDPNLSVEQVGVPIHIAKILTIPEKVTSFNKEWLTKLTSNGVEYPGANYVISKDAKGVEFKRFLMYGKNKELKIGDIVERHLLNDDVLLFNRQPSLHRMSIMGHKAKIHNHKTLRFNECDCSSYNADFDGDEMNIHLPQTLEARVEALELMGIKNNICTARNGEPLISCTQDFLTGSYILTGKEVFFTRERFAQLCAYAVSNGQYKINVKPVIIYPVELFTGKQIFEVIISHSTLEGARYRNSLSNTKCKFKPINLSAKNRSFKTEDDPNEGYVLIKNNRYIKGRLDKSIIGGENRKGSLIYQLMKQSRECAVFIMNAISRVSVRYLMETGFSIGLDDVYPSERLICEKNRIIKDGYRQVEEYIKRAGEGAGIEARANLEMEISMVLSRIRDECGNICVNELSRRNSPVIMQECGSKGSKINVSQMIACVGQQIISGHRIPEGMHKRTLPHFEMNSLLPESRGFVLNSFFTGMHGYEFFFHAVSGREGLVDTAVKTAETGYMQRRLMKALEDLSIKYDYTVRNSFNDLVQYNYGEDNVEPLKNEDEEFLKWIFDECVCDFINEMKITDNVVYNFLGSDFSFIDFLNNFFINKIDSKFYLGNRVFEILNNLIDNKLTKMIINEKFIGDLISFIRKNENSELFYKGAFYKYFQNRKFIEDFLFILSNRIFNLVAQPGTAVGAIAGQSIGEPGTQMTLKTFHFAGVASMNITLGVPRLKEIINAAANINTPIIKGRLQSTSLESAKIIKGRIEKVLFKELCSKITQSISQDGIVIVFEIDTNLIFGLRLELTIEKIKNILLRSLKTASIEAVGNTIRYTMKRLKDNSMFAREKIKKQILETKICGLNNISRVVINQTSKNHQEKSYELLIEGNGLLEVFGIPGIDAYGTTSNNILEVSKYLGIEAARTLIIREIEYTMGKHGIKIDHRHVMLLSDTMTSKGEVLGITRFGIGKMRSSTLMLASFEQTAEHLFTAAVHGKEEKIEGVSESIIMGVPISLGTGSIQLLWNEKMNK